jgi:hypothetical protein
MTFAKKNVRWMQTMGCAAGSIALLAAACSDTDPSDAERAGVSARHARIERSLPATATSVKIVDFTDSGDVQKTKVAYVVDGESRSEVYDAQTGERLWPARATFQRSRETPAIGEHFKAALATMRPDARVEVDVYVPDETDALLPYRSAAVSREQVDGNWVHRIDGAIATDAELAALADEMHEGLQASERARLERRQRRVEAIEGRLGALGLRREAGGASLSGKLTRDEVLRAAEACGPECSSIEPREDTGTGAVDLAGINAEMGLKDWAFPVNEDGRNVGVWVRDDGYPKIPSPFGNSIDTTRLTKLDTNLAGTDHTTLVVSALQSTAPRAHLYVGSGNSCFIRDNLSSLTSPRVYVSSHSWSWSDSNVSTYGECARQWDNFVYNQGIATFFLAHNQANFVTTPGKGYNIVAVGGYNPTTNTMYADSNYKNPETGAEKPEIVAPGADLKIGTWTGSGTSISTPLAAGFAADLISFDTNFFGYKPELVKATMMAAGLKNIEGAAPISDKDGAGAIHYRGAYCSYRSWQGNFNQFFDANGNIDVPFSLQGGLHYRIAISWLVSGDYTFVNKRNSIDLDLSLRLGSTQIASSASIFQTFEILDLAASQSQTGAHTVRITRFWRGNNDKNAIGLVVCQVP